MPNWCENVLNVRGDDQELARFRKAAKRRREYRDGTSEDCALSFECFLPVPEELNAPIPGWSEDAVEQSHREKHAAELAARYGYPNWYEFQCAKWGTKSDAVDVEVQSERDELTYSFDTAWSPPRPVVLAASRLFPTLSFELRYWEPGNGFRGELECRLGEAVVDMCRRWNPFDDPDDEAIYDDGNASMEEGDHVTAAAPDAANGGVSLVLANGNDQLNLADVIGGSGFVAWDTGHDHDVLVVHLDIEGRYPVVGTVPEDEVGWLCAFMRNDCRNGRRVLVGFTGGSAEPGGGVYDVHAHLYCPIANLASYYRDSMNSEEWTGR